MNTYKWLLKREFWESRGGFLWAPAIAGLVFIVLNIMGFITALVLGSRENIQVSGVRLGEMTGDLRPDEIAQLGAGLDLALYMSVTWPLMVLAFVVFFYALSSLYDERRDRSVLFWKSLPLSDRDTVVAKAVTALVTAPVIATLIGIATMFAFLLVLCVFVLAHGGNPFTLVIGPASPLKVALHSLMWLPVYACWALPTVGWLMLCSVWAKTKPFLWAVLIPIFAGVMVSWFQIMKLFDLGAGWFWAHVVARGLFSTVTGSDIFYRGIDVFSGVRGPEDLTQMFSPSFAFQAFAMPQMWIGMAVGIAFIVIAIRLRRWRDEG